MKHPELVEKLLGKSKRVNWSVRLNSDLARRMEELRTELEKESGVHVSQSTLTELVFDEYLCKIKKTS